MLPATEVLALHCASCWPLALRVLQGALKLSALISHSVGRCPIHLMDKPSLGSFNEMRSFSRAPIAPVDTLLARRYGS